MLPINCREPRRAFTKVLALTLAREDEVAEMPWAELDGGLWRLPAERHKGKRGYDMPMPTQAVELIEALPRVIDHVFYSGAGPPDRRLSAASRPKSTG